MTWYAMIYDDIWLYDMIDYKYYDMFCYDDMMWCDAMWLQWRKHLVLLLNKQGGISEWDLDSQKYQAINIHCNTIK